MAELLPASIHAEANVIEELERTLREIQVLIICLGESVTHLASPKTGEWIFGVSGNIVGLANVSPGDLRIDAGKEESRFYRGYVEELRAKVQVGKSHLDCLPNTVALALDKKAGKPWAKMVRSCLGRVTIWPDEPHNTLSAKKIPRNVRDFLFLIAAYDPRPKWHEYEQLLQSYREQLATLPLELGNATEIASESHGHTLRRLLTALTGGLLDNRVDAVVGVLSNPALNVNEKLRQWDDALPIPANLSARKLGDLLGVTGFAIQKTLWWKEKRSGRAKVVVQGRKEQHLDRSKRIDTQRDED